MDIIRVASHSRTSSVAGSIAHAIREKGYIDAQSIGAGAVNQMIKAAIMAKQYLAEEGISLVFSPTFTKLEISGKECTAIRVSIFAIENGLSPDGERKVDV